MLSLNRIGAGVMLLKQVYGQTSANSKSNKGGIRKPSTPLTKNTLPPSAKPKNR